MIYLAAVMAWRVTGLRRSLLCSTRTRLLWLLNSSWARLLAYTSNRLTTRGVQDGTIEKCTNLIYKEKNIKRKERGEEESVRKQERGNTKRKYKIKRVK